MAVHYTTCTPLDDDERLQLAQLTCTAMSKDGIVGQKIDELSDGQMFLETHAPNYMQCNYNSLEDDGEADEKDVQFADAINELSSDPDLALS